jgi:hypothetical protein
MKKLIASLAVAGALVWGAAGLAQASTPTKDVTFTHTYSSDRTHSYAYECPDGWTNQGVGLYVVSGAASLENVSYFREGGTLLGVRYSVDTEGPTKVQIQIVCQKL